MKVLIIAPWIRQGGAELITVETAIQLQKLGHTVRVASLFVNTSSMDEGARRLRYVDFGPVMGSLFQRSKFLLYFMGPFFLFWLTLRQAAWADVLFPHTLPAYWVAPLVGRIFDKRVVWLCNEPPRKRGLGEIPFLDFLMWRMADSFMDTLFTRWIDRTIVYSKIIKEEVKSRYGLSSTMVRLGIRADFFAKKDRKVVAMLKTKYKLSGKFVLLMVGKLHPQKNQGLALETLNKIRTKTRKAVLVLVGEGPDTERLKAKVREMKIEKKVVFTGFCPPPIVRVWYEIADLVLFPSVGQTAKSNQSWGFIPFEALCQEKISVVSEGSGAAEVLAKEKIGIVASPTLTGFSRAVLNFYRRKKEYRKMAERGKIYVEKNLSWETWGKGVEKVLVSAIER